MVTAPLAGCSAHSAMRRSVSLRTPPSSRKTVRSTGGNLAISHLWRAAFTLGMTSPDISSMERRARGGSIQS